jgi:hypothetical protein
MAIDFNHELVGRIVVYRGWHPNAEAEQGPITSVNVEANLVFVRYGRGSTSAATACDDRLTFLDGGPVRLFSPEPSTLPTSEAQP